MNAILFLCVITCGPQDQAPQAFAPYFDLGAVRKPTSNDPRTLPFDVALTVEAPRGRDLASEILQLTVLPGRPAATLVSEVGASPSAAAAGIPDELQRARSALVQALSNLQAEDLHTRGFSFPTEYQGTVSDTDYQEAVVAANKQLGHKYKIKNYDWPFAQGLRIIRTDGVSWPEAITAIKTFDRNLDNYPNWPIEEKYWYATLKTLVNNSPLSQTSLVEYKLLRGYKYWLVTQDAFQKHDALTYYTTSYYAERTKRDEFFWHMSGRDTYIPIYSGDGQLVAVAAVTRLTMDITGYGGESPEATIRESLGAICASTESLLASKNKTK